MIQLPEIWKILQEYMQRGTWTHIHQIYDLVEKHDDLDDNDFYPQSPTSNIPKWKRNVRNVLWYRTNVTKELQWNKNEHYLLP